ncbi:MAG: hypothetical protein H7287_12965 [Thermoleophilia bacterium]|nr:hypothetical protein [Thermoleophilia bacterium]
MTTIQHDSSRQLRATFGKAALGSAVPLAVAGAVHGKIGALPAAIWGLGGGLLAAAATTGLQAAGVDESRAGIIGGLGTAAAILGGAALIGLTHGGVGMSSALRFATMPAIGALTGGLTAALWH